MRLEKLQARQLILGLMVAGIVTGLGAVFPENENTTPPDSRREQPRHSAFIPAWLISAHETATDFGQVDCPIEEANGRLLPRRIYRMKKGQVCWTNAHGVWRDYEGSWLDGAQAAFDEPLDTNLMQIKRCEKGFYILGERYNSHEKPHGRPFLKERRQELGPWALQVVGECNVS